MHCYMTSSLINHYTFLILVNPVAASYLKINVLHAKHPKETSISVNSFATHYSAINFLHLQFQFHTFSLFRNYFTNLIFYLREDKT